MKNTEIVDVIIIGAGQAGLTTSYYLNFYKINHVVLEQDCVGSSWEKQRWDSFKMNTPNWMTSLPGRDIMLEQREQFMTKAEFVDYLKAYAAQFKLPILENQKVIGIEKECDGFVVTVNKKGIFSNLQAKAVVVASGIMNKVSFPILSESIPRHIVQLHAATYKNMKQLPAGNILIVGAGQSGCQIAQELALAKRKVFLAGSKVARAPRRYRGKDIMEWMDQIGLMDISTELLKDNPSLNTTQPQVSGIGPLGHTISYQSLYQLGVTILGGLKDVDHSTFYLHENCKNNIRFADDTSHAIKKNIDDFLKQNPEIAVEKVEEDIADISDHNYKAASELKAVSFDDSGITTVIWATGFGYDFQYLNSSLLDTTGKPRHVEGKMLVEGLYCLGFPWLRKKKSGLVYGVNEDAKTIVEYILNHLHINYS